MARRITRDGKQDEGRKAGRDEMDKENELPPACELANLLTYLLAYLRTCPLYLLCFLGGRLVARLVPARSVHRPAIPPRPHRIPVPPGDTRGGAVFLICSPHSPGSYFSRSRAVFPSSFIPSFRHAVLSLVSPVVCNVIFLYLTFVMLKAKK